MRFGLDLSKLGSADGLGTFTREALSALVREGYNRHTFFGYDLLGETALAEACAASGLPCPTGRRPAEDALDVFLSTSFQVPELAAETRLLFVVYDLTFLSLPHCHTLGNRLHCLEGLVAALGRISGLPAQPPGTAELQLGASSSPPGAELELGDPGFKAGGGQLLAISRHGAEELAALLGRDAASFPVLPLAPAAAFRRLATPEITTALAPLGLQPGAYVLSVGSLEPRKNLAALLRAHGELPAALRAAFPLVLAGSPGWHNAELKAELERETQTGHVRHLGRVELETLVALYNGAALFAYPSLAEGYGLPVVEAMACGAPVLTSTTSALPETAGGAARLVDPHDPAALATSLAELLASPETREDLRRRGQARVAALSWQKTAQVLLDLLQDPTRKLP